MLGHIAQAKIMKPAKLYSRPLCGWCQEAKAYLTENKIPFEYIDVGRDRAANEEMVRLSGQTYVPTIVIDGHVLADFDVEQLKKFLAKINAGPN
jgi:glutaredoxin